MKKVKAVFADTEEQLYKVDLSESDVIFLKSEDDYCKIVKNTIVSNDVGKRLKISFLEEYLELLESAIKHKKGKPNSVIDSNNIKEQVQKTFGGVTDAVSLKIQIEKLKGVLAIAVEEGLANQEFVNTTRNKIESLEKELKTKKILEKDENIDVQDLFDAGLKELNDSLDSFIKYFRSMDE